MRAHGSASASLRLELRPGGTGGLSGTISATGCSWARGPAKGHENGRLCRMAVLGAARSRLAME